VESVTAVTPESIPSSQTKILELSGKAHHVVIKESTDYGQARSCHYRRDMGYNIPHSRISQKMAELRERKLIVKIAHGQARRNGA
jgi:hypothetical protein